MAKAPISVAKATDVSKLVKKQRWHVEQRHIHSQLKDAYEKAKLLHGRLHDESGWHQALALQHHHARQEQFHDNGANELQDQINRLGGNIMENYDPRDEEDETPDIPDEDYEDYEDDQDVNEALLLQRSKAVRAGNVLQVCEIDRQIRESSNPRTSVREHAITSERFHEIMGSKKGWSKTGRPHEYSHPEQGVVTFNPPSKKGSVVGSVSHKKGEGAAINYVNIPDLHKAIS